MEELSLDNILGTDEIDNLFVDEETQETPPPENDGDNENPEKETETKEKTTEVNVDTLFTEEPESVGSGKDDTEEKEGIPSGEEGTSPKNFYSSIAKALKEEGIFPDLDEESYSKIKEPEDFRELVEQQIKSGLDERLKRIDEALSVGVEPSEIRKYENTINYLNNIEDSVISEESEDGEKIRKNLIFQDFINRGYSKERATREVQKSFNAGTDIDDAKEALKSNVEYFSEKYNDLVDEAKEEAEQAKKDRDVQINKLKNSILEDKQMLGELKLDKSTRQRVFDNIAKPIYKDPDTGEYFTAIQKYERENKLDFLKNISLIYTLTDGFKNLDGLVKGRVNKEVKKGLRELENTLNNTSRNSDGSLRFVSGVNDDPESIIGKGLKLDI